MNAIKLLAISCLGFGILAGSTGCSLQCAENEEDDGTTCIAKPLKFVQASQPKVTRVNYAPGGSLDVRTNNGSITIVNGSEDQIVVETTPKSGKPQDTPDEEFTAELEGLNDRTEATGDGSGGAVVRAPGGGFDSVSVVVRLPAGFNGTIKLNQGNGGTDVKGVASATALDIFSDNGSCDIRGASTVVSTSVNCENGTTAVLGVANAVNITAGNGDLTVQLVSIEGGGGSITAENGDIELGLPAAGDYSVQAVASELVDFGSAPGGCSVAEAAVNSKTLSCNAGGPNYVVEALGPGATVTASY